MLDPFTPADYSVGVSAHGVPGTAGFHAKGPGVIMPGPTSWAAVVATGWTEFEGDCKLGFDFEEADG